MTAVRWRQHRNYRTGHLTGRTNPDGSLEIVDDRYRAVRNIMPERVEQATAGPRGGTRWVPYKELSCEQP